MDFVPEDIISPVKSLETVIQTIMVNESTFMIVCDFLFYCICMLIAAID